MFTNIFSNKSKILLQTGEDDAGYNHLKYWIPEFLKLKMNLTILVRTEKLFKQIKNDYRTLDILYAKSALDVEAVLSKLENLSTIFYMSNTWNNIHLLRFNQYKHIFIGTENSDRDASVSKVFRAYDELWLSSQSAIDKISSQIDISSMSILKIGKPQLKEIIEVKNNQSKSILYFISNEGSTEDDNLSSIEILKENLINLSNQNFKIDIILNKDIGKRNKIYKEIKTLLNEFLLINNFNCKIYNSLYDELLNNYQYIICDLNTYNLKLLATDSIIYLYLPKDKNYEKMLKNKFISFDELYQFSSSEELLSMMNEKDIMKVKREEFIEYWIGKSYIEDSQFEINLKKVQNEIKK